MQDRITPLFGPGEIEDSIVIRDRAFDIGTRVHKWTEHTGFSSYDENVSRFIREDRSTIPRVRTIKGKRYSSRPLGAESISQVLIHHTGGDGNGASRVYNTLHNQRGLSVHFVIDDDGAIWQFLDVEACAWHAGSHNGCSVGIECNLYPFADKRPNYYSEKNRKRRGNLPHDVGIDMIHGREIRVFQFTTRQVEACAKLAAGIWVGLYLVTRNDRFVAAPRFPLIDGAIAKTEIEMPLSHVGLIGHLQCTRRKIDPAGFPWERFEARVSEVVEQMFDSNLETSQE